MGKRRNADRFRFIPERVKLKVLKFFRDECESRALLRGNIDSEVVDEERKEVDRYRFIPGLVVRIALALFYPLTRLLVRIQLTANNVTALGLILTCGAASLISFGYFAWGAILLLLGGLCDWLDGAVARHTNACTTQGREFDYLADRFSDALPYIALYFYFTGENDLLNRMIVASALSVTFRISSVRRCALRLQLHKTCAGILQRQHRLLMLAAGLLLCNVFPLPPQIATPTVLFFFGPKVVIVWPLIITIIGIIILGTITIIQRLLTAIFSTEDLRILLPLFYGDGVRNGSSQNVLPP